MTVKQIRAFLERLPQRYDDVQVVVDDPANGEAFFAKAEAFEPEEVLITGTGFVGRLAVCIGREFAKPEAYQHRNIHKGARRAARLRREAMA